MDEHSLLSFVRCSVGMRSISAFCLETRKRKCLDGPVNSVVPIYHPHPTVVTDQNHI
jgi:hypothetical protein